MDSATDGHDVDLLSAIAKTCGFLGSFLAELKGVGLLLAEGVSF